MSRLEGAPTHTPARQTGEFPPSRAGRFQSSRRVVGARRHGMRHRTAGGPALDTAVGTVACGRSRSGSPGRRRRVLLPHHRSARLVHRVQGGAEAVRSGSNLGEVQTRLTRAWCFRSIQHFLNPVAAHVLHVLLVFEDDA